MSSQNTLAFANISGASPKNFATATTTSAVTTPAPLATPKSQDLLSHRGREFQLLDQPLERYFSMIGQRPCEGEYTAKWEIEDGWLYLSGLGCVQKHEQPMSMESLFPFAGRRVFAAWYSGQIRGFRADRATAQAWGQPNRYPDLVLNMNCGRIETISLVHSSDRVKPVAEPLSALGSRPNQLEGLPLAAQKGNVLPFMPRTADATWNPGWHGALV
jgi:hypothetical protein